MSAIYSFSMSNISRGGKASATASYAYISGEEVTDERTGVVKKYSREDEVLATGNIVPEDAPQKYKDSAANWCNDLEVMEKDTKARTAKRVRIAFPSELSLEQQIEATEKWIDENCTKHGYPATYAIHSSKDGKNPHVHIIIANRALEKGRWQQSKSKTEFRRDENGNKIPVIDPKTGQQKIIINKQGKKKKQWQRYQKKENRSHMDKLSTLYDMRKGWARVCNEYLPEDKQIDHRSYEAQGKLQIPTRHEGHAARELEARGGTADVCEYNRQVKIKNKEIQKELAQLDEREARRREQVESLISSVEKSISPALKGKEALEVEGVLFDIKNMMYDTHAKELEAEAAKVLGVDRERAEVEKALAGIRQDIETAQKEHYNKRLPLLAEEREAGEGLENARKNLQKLEKAEEERLNRGFFKMLLSSKDKKGLEKAGKALKIAEKRHLQAKTALTELDQQHKASLQPLQAKAGKLEARAEGIQKAIWGKVDEIGSKRVFGYAKIEKAIQKFDNRHTLTPAKAGGALGAVKGAAGKVGGAVGTAAGAVKGAVSQGVGAILGKADGRGMQGVMEDTAAEVAKSLVQGNIMGAGMAVAQMPLAILKNVESEDVKRDKMREAQEKADAESLLPGGKGKKQEQDKDEKGKGNAQEAPKVMVRSR